ncbi:hypothetical protein PTSG_07612 [Salpingoeca rosetta]|uniref:Dynein regulatory complex protein 10 n=1 Tax=Salpingoeca rosetta (strain ATCC 50818 / BSB-021) TaxID=946362 RepID=F2UH96_SALR5|nr:uncharacterized protein PTSG_07612 [Salpingoeca rosetta]EGD76495.1 hypothetical protein PTSG_07612 [Salpingoeca rosetta]|eukprot:XP_004991409.1 hypothetical protein PTSG_07612 [Salpingoeca rosetta]
MSQQQQRINSVVGERIAAVVDDMLTRCALLPHLCSACVVRDDANESDAENARPASNTSEFAWDGASQLSEDTLQMLQAHRRTEKTYAADTDNRELSIAVEESTRKLMHHLSKRPHEAQALRQRPVHLPESFKTLTQRLQQLRDVLYLKLTTNVEDERSQQEKVNKLRANEKKNIATLKSLETKLRQAQREHHQETERRDAIIADLEDDLDFIAHSAAEHSRQTLREARRKQDHHEHTMNTDGKQLNEQLDKLEKELASMRKKHKDEETKLRKRKLKLQAQIEGWIMKYDQDMGEKQRELDGIQQQYGAESKQLQELEERFNVLEIEYNRIMEERRAEREYKQQAEEEMQKMIRAALLIQSCWKAYKSRKAARKAAAKKNKKKGKKKK